MVQVHTEDRRAWKFPFWTDFLFLKLPENTDVVHQENKKIKQAKIISLQGYSSTSMVFT